MGGISLAGSRQGWTNTFPQVFGDPWVSYSLIGKRSFLPSKSCIYCSPDRRCFKTLSWWQTIFTSHQMKQLLNGKDHLWMSDQRILRYQVVLVENPGLTIPLCKVLNPATLLPTPRWLSPFSLLPRNFEPLNKTPRGTVRISSDQSWGNLVHWWKQICLGWKKSWICSSLQF